MQATEILTSLRSEKPNTSRFKAPAVESGWLLEGRSLTILTSLRSERPELLLRTRPMGDWGKGDGAALTTLTSLRSERSGTATETDQEERRHGNEKKVQTKKTRRGVRVALTTLTSLRSERPGTTRGGGRGRANSRAWSNGGAKEGGSKAQTFKLRVDKCWIANSKQWAQLVRKERWPTVR